MTRVVAGLVAGFSIAVVVFNLMHIQDFGLFAFIPISLSPFALVGRCSSLGSPATLWAGC